MVTHEFKFQRITSISDFLCFVPKLSVLFAELDGLWEPDMNKDQFINSVLDAFNGGAFVFLAEGDKSDFAYVAIVERTSQSLGHFWLFYVNKDYREQTKTLVYLIKDFCRSQGITRLRFTTTRLTSSYDRWVEKFGASKIAVTYEMES